MQYPHELNYVFEEIHSLNGYGLIVGGAVRDSLLGLTPKDFDVEVYGLTPEKLDFCLSKFGSVNAVGRNFGVFKLKLGNNEYDFSIPRRESKQGKGHKGFMVAPDPTLSPADAALRRDFTINSMGFNPRTNKIVDFHGGMRDLNYRMLRPTSEAFKDDPLRVLRAMQFLSRFQMNRTSELIRYSKEMFDEYQDLPKERVWEEWKKLFLKGKEFDLAINFLHSCNWLQHFPELNVLRNIEQDPEWHPEGNVLKHTVYCVDAAIHIANENNLIEDDRLVYLLAVLCHDLGKATTTQFIDGHWKAPGHDVAGVPLTESFLNSIGCPPSIIQRVLPLVQWHMAHCNTEISKKFVRKISLVICPATIRELNLVVLADMSGRPPKPAFLPENAKRIAELAEGMDVITKPVMPLLMGRHLLEKGLTPGPEYGKLLKEAFDEQIKDTFTDLPGALLWLEEKLKCETLN